MTYTFWHRAQAAGPAVWVALADSGWAYAELVDGMRAELERTNIAVELQARPWREFPPNPAEPPRLIVAVGAAALAGMMESGAKAPILAVLMPRATYERVAGRGRGGRQLSAIWLDQPPQRQLEFLRLALPGRQRIGVLYGAESQTLLPGLREAATARGMQLIGGRIEEGDSFGGTLRAVLDESDVLLALPDPQVFNSHTIQNVLLAAYRRRVPLIGFSPAYVKAGALLAIYSTPAQIGAQAADAVRAALAGRPLPPAQPPREFSVSGNAEVARSLGLSFGLHDVADWQERLRGKGHAP